MPSKKITGMPNLAGAQVAGDLVTLVDLSQIPGLQNVKSSLTDFFGNVPVPVNINNSALSIIGSNPQIILTDTDGGDDDALISLQADLLSTSVGGGTAVSQRANGQLIGFKRTIAINLTPAQSTGSGASNLQSVVIQANSLANNNDFLEIECAFTYAANANGKQVAWTFGGQTIEDGFTPMVFGTGGNFRGCRGYFSIYRLSATTVLACSTQHSLYAMISGAGTPNMPAAVGWHELNRIANPLTVTNLNANNQTLQFSCVGTATADIVQVLTRVDLCQLS